MSRLDEIKQRVAKATPGPWRTDAGDSVVLILTADGAPVAVTSTKAYYERHDQTDVANAALIAHAPADLAFLLGEVERLQAAITAAVQAQKEADAAFHGKFTGALVSAAVTWWESRKPLAFNLDQHLANPTVNCSTTQEQAVALEVSMYLSAIRRPMSSETNLTEEAKELKPCPFCGGEAEEAHGLTGDGLPWLYVECLKCAATAQTPEEWNRRATFISRTAADREATEPKGWKLVPVDPTEEMLDAGGYQIGLDVYCCQQAGRAYKAMLEAAPAPALAALKGE